MVYAITYALVRNIVALWPLLLPLGSFYSNVSSGEIHMPSIAILGFLDVLALMATAIWLAIRHGRRQDRQGEVHSEAVEHHSATNAGHTTQPMYRDQLAARLIGRLIPVPVGL